MGHVAYHSHRDQGIFSLGGVVSILARGATSLKRRMQLRRVQLHLENMDDRLLNDIGLERGDIHSAVWRGRKMSDR